jgi:hypothetical protein
MAILLFASLIGYLPSPILSALAAHDDEAKRGMEALVRLTQINCVNLAKIANSDPALCHAVGSKQ